MLLTSAGASLGAVGLERDGFAQAPTRGAATNSVERPRHMDDLERYIAVDNKCLSFSWFSSLLRSGLYPLLGFVVGFIPPAVETELRRL